jgi:hypothetical protein
MFKKKRIRDFQSLEGVITFFGSHHALRSEQILKKRDIKAELIPGPREISPNCGVALRFDYSKREQVKKILDEFLVHYEDIHYYPVH